MSCQCLHSNLSSLSLSVLLPQFRIRFNWRHGWHWPYIDNITARGRYVRQHYILEVTRGYIFRCLKSKPVNQTAQTAALPALASCAWCMAHVQLYLIPLFSVPCLTSASPLKSISDKSVPFSCYHTKWLYKIFTPGPVLPSPNNKWLLINFQTF